MLRVKFACCPRDMTHPSSATSGSPQKTLWIACFLLEDHAQSLAFTGQIDLLKTLWSGRATCSLGLECVLNSYIQLDCQRA